jgi:hypothetical protein
MGHDGEVRGFCRNIRVCTNEAILEANDEQCKFAPLTENISSGRRNFYCIFYITVADLRKSLLDHPDGRARPRLIRSQIHRSSWRADHSQRLRETRNIVDLEKTRALAVSITLRSRAQIPPHFQLEQPFVTDTYASFQFQSLQSVYTLLLYKFLSAISVLRVNGTIY